MVYAEQSDIIEDGRTLSDSNIQEELLRCLKANITQLYDEILMEIDIAKKKKKQQKTQMTASQLKSEERRISRWALFIKVIIRLLKFIFTFLNTENQDVCPFCGRRHKP